jgi:hypothetical protein
MTEQKEQPEKEHELKCWTPSFQALRSGVKTFELRKNDRDYHVGEVLKLREWNPDTDYTGEIDRYKITWILYEGFGLPEGYCIMSVVPLSSALTQDTTGQDGYFITEETVNEVNEIVWKGFDCESRCRPFELITKIPIQQHDEQIRQDATEKVLDKLGVLISQHSPWSEKDGVAQYAIPVWQLDRWLKSLRRKEQSPEQRVMPG